MKLNTYICRCGDPFNYTLNVEDMPAMMKCEGCCVKLVGMNDLSHERIRLKFGKD